MLPCCELLLLVIQQSLQGRMMKASNYGMHALLDHQKLAIIASI